MRTSLDLPDPLFKHLKARAALEGRTLRELVIELVEKGLNAQEVADPQQRLMARPLIVSDLPWAVPLHQMNNTELQALAHEDDDERARGFLARR
jgi:hypothetical protein